MIDRYSNKDSFDSTPFNTDRKKKNLVRLVIQTTHKHNVRLGNALDVDLNII